MIKIPQIKTVIGQDTIIEGDIRFSGALHLDGQIKGNVHGEAQSTLIIGQNGQIEGDVHIENLVLDGTIKGNVHASHQVELASHAKVSGSVQYHLLEMAEGASVTGQFIHQNEVTK